MRLLERILERVESIDRNVEEILDWLSDHLEGDYSWYENNDSENNHDTDNGYG
ncbi:MAG: hypothetical protein HYR83_13730 [Planctomycetes bacterium]|nr:hypothetical protein [Planctomycetota bacterium]